VCFGTDFRVRLCRYVTSAQRHAPRPATLPLTAKAKRHVVSNEFERLLRKGEPKPRWWKRVFGSWWSGSGTKKVRVDSRSASDLLRRVRALREAGAGWLAILSAVNPRNDKVAAGLLTKLHGPHQFAPHVALNVLEDACERVIAANPRASDIDALREALSRSDFATR
jgi:hypothetical protein